MPVTFQRRHYLAVAEILSQARQDAYRSQDLFAVGLIEQMAERFADMFKADNGRFSRQRFEDAAKGV